MRMQVIRTCVAAMQDLASRLRSARKSAHLRPVELDAKAGLTKGHTGLVETRRRRQPSIETVRLLAKALGVSICWLATGHRCCAVDTPN